MNFWSKLEIATRLSLATIISLVVESFYPWSENVTWWSVTLIIIGMKENLGETLMAMVQTWIGILYILPIIVLFHWLRFSIFFSLILLPLFIFCFLLFASSVSDDGKRLAMIVLVWNVYLPTQLDSKINTFFLLWNLLKGVFVANLVNFTIICLPIRLPNLSICQISNIYVPKLQHSMETALNLLVYKFCNIPIIHQEKSQKVNISKQNIHYENLGTNVSVSIQDEKSNKAVSHFEIDFNDKINSDDKTSDNWPIQTKEDEQINIVQLEEIEHSLSEGENMKDNIDHIKNYRKGTTYIRPLKNVNIEDSIELSNSMIASIKAAIPSAKYELYFFHIVKSFIAFLFHLLLLPFSWHKSCPSMSQFILQLKVGYQEIQNQVNSITKYIEILAEVNNCLHGMLAAANDIVPNHTHEEYLKEISLPILQLLDTLQCEVLAFSLSFLQKQLNLIFSIKWRDIFYNSRFLFNCFICMQKTELKQDPFNKDLQENSRESHSELQEETINKIFDKTMNILEIVLEKLICARMRVIYGIDITTDSINFKLDKEESSFSNGKTTNVNNLNYEYSDIALRSKKKFDEESKRIGYRNLVPRNTFILELTNLVHNLKSLLTHVMKYQKMHLMKKNVGSIHTEQPQSHSVTFTNTLDAHTIKSENLDEPNNLVNTDSNMSTDQTKEINSGTNQVSTNKNTTNILESGSIQIQIAFHCFKIAFCIFVSSSVVLVPTLNKIFGPQTIWCPIAVCQTMTIVTFSNIQKVSPSSSSSYKSGINRCIGTIVGAVYGFALEKWITFETPIKSNWNLYLIIMMAIWVFFCGFNKKDIHYGEIMFTAAMTSPIMILGPVDGDSGVVVRVQQIIMGTLIYVIIDNLLYPFRAKRELKKVMQISLGSFSLVWNSSLNHFLRQQKKNESY